MNIFGVLHLDPWTFLARNDFSNGRWRLLGAVGVEVSADDRLNKLMKGFGKGRVYIKENKNNSFFLNVTFNKCLVIFRYPVICKFSVLFRVLWEKNKSFLQYPKDHWTLKTAYFEDPNPASYGFRAPSIGESKILRVQQFDDILLLNKLGLWISSIFPRRVGDWKQPTVGWMVQKSQTPKQRLDVENS